MFSPTTVILHWSVGCVVCVYAVAVLVYIFSIWSHKVIPPPLLPVNRIQGCKQSVYPAISYVQPYKRMP